MGRGRAFSALLRAQGNVDVEYSLVCVALGSTVDIDGLTVRTPAPLRDVAPDLLHIGHVHVEYSWASMRHGGAFVQRIDLRDVKITVVDRDGHTSLDSSTPSTEAPLPRSQTLAAALTGGAPLRGLHIDGLEVTLARIRGEVREDYSITARGTIDLETAGSDAFSVRLGLGKATEPLDVTVTRGAERARASLSLDIGASSSSITAVLELGPREQTFLPGVKLTESLVAHLRATFDRERKRIGVAFDAHLPETVAIDDARGDIPHDGPIVVQSGRGDIDGGKLLALLPEGLVPVKVASAHAHWVASDVVLGPRPAGGTLDLESDVDGLTAQLAVPLQATGGKLSAHVRSGAEGNVEAHATGTVKSAAYGLASVDGLDLDATATFEQGAWNGHAKVALARFTAPSVTVTKADVETQAKDLRVDPTVPLASRGDAVVTATAAELVTPWVSADSPRARVHAPLSGGPLAFDGDASSVSLHLRNIGSFPARATFAVTGLVPDGAHPQATRGNAHVTAEVASLHATASVIKNATTATFEVDASMPSLEDVHPYVSGPLASSFLGANVRLVALEGSCDTPRYPFAVARGGQLCRSTGRIARTILGEGDRPHHALAEGDAMLHDGTAELRLDGLAIDGGNASDDRVTLTAHVERAKPAARVEVAVSGRTTAKINVTASIDRASRALVFEAGADVDRMTGLLPLLAPFPAASRVFDHLDPAKLSVSLSSRGHVAGLVDGVTPGGVVTWSHGPLDAVTIDGDIDLHAREVHYAQNEVAFDIPTVAWHGDLQTTSSGARDLDGHIDLPDFRLVFGRHKLDIAGLKDKLRVEVTGNLKDPVITLKQSMTVASMKHDLAPWYPLGNVTFAIDARREHDWVRLDQLSIQNADGGTMGRVTGRFDLDESHRRLSLRVELDQDLARVSRMTDTYTGRGRVGVTMTIDSHDPSAVRVRAEARITDAYAHFGKAGVDVERVNGQIPVAVVLKLDAHGITVLSDGKMNPYALMRFADQHPLVAGQSFLSVDSITTPWFKLAPIAGNLQVDQNIVSLRQFETGVRGGRLTGDCILDWEGEASLATVRLRATGVKSSHGEPFDGSSALVVSAKDRTIEGRTEIVRIGERHLLDLLDFQDPSHSDAAMNRIRTAASLSAIQTG